MFSSRQLIIFCLTILITCCCQVFAMTEEQPFAAAAMTTVLARPLGGYGLTPLVFEPHQSQMQGSSSNSVPTKVRKSPVYELMMPNYDEESASSTISSLSPTTTTADALIGTKTLKKLDYESLVSTATNKPLLTSNSNKITPAAAIVSSASSSNDYYSSMLDLLKGSSSPYNTVAAAELPSYKENSIGGGLGGGLKTSMFNQNQFIQQQPQLRGGFANEYSSGPQGPFTAAIQSIRSVELNDVQDSYENGEPQVIDIPPSAMPIVINFRTSASQIQIHQSHEPSEPREVQETTSQDEPHFLKHSVTKPVIQEVHEIIMPYRRIIQEIRPVEEEVKTIVARNSGAGKGQQQQVLNGLVGGGAAGLGAIGADQLLSAGIAIKQGGGGGTKGANAALAYAMNKLAGNNNNSKYKSS